MLVILSECFFNVDDLKICGEDVPGVFFRKDTSEYSVIQPKRWLELE